MLVVNGTLVVSCILVAIYYPQISTVLRYGSRLPNIPAHASGSPILLFACAHLRYTGAIFGLVGVFLLPVTFHLVDQHRHGRLTARSMFFHASLCALGLANLVAQFF